MKISMELMKNITSYMNDEIRENLHSELATLNPTEKDNENFLNEYLKKDPDFSKLLKSEFNIEM